MAGDDCVDAVVLVITPYLLQFADMPTMRAKYELTRLAPAIVYH